MRKISSRRSLFFGGKRVWDFSSGSLISGTSIQRVGGNATYFDVNGVMRITSVDDTARFNYNPTTLALEGLYVERSATNLLVYSEQFDNVVWTKSTATITANTLTTPDGNSFGDRYTRNATGECRVRQTTTQTNSTVYTLSCVAQPGTSNFLRLRNIALLTTGITDTAWFNVSTGVVGTVGGNIAAAAITSFGGGWYRCAMRGATLASIGGLNLVDVASATSNGEVSGGTNGETLGIWGVQLEIGTPTSYIPTTTTTVTRNAESLVLQNVTASTLRITFDDNSTQNISVTPGTVTIAASSLNRSLVRKVEEI